MTLVEIFTGRRIELPIILLNLAVSLAANGNRGLSYVLWKIIEIWETIRFIALTLTQRGHSLVLCVYRGNSTKNFRFIISCAGLMGYLLRRRIVIGWTWIGSITRIHSNSVDIH